MVASIGGIGGLLATDEAEAGGAGKLSAVIALMKQMSKNKYKGEGNLGRVYKDLKKLDTNFKDFHYEPGSGGNYGTIQLRFPNGDLMETQIASTSHVVADDQLVKRLRGARAQIDPNFKADEGSNYSKWTKVAGGSLAAGGANASEGGQQLNPFMPYVDGFNDVHQNYMVKSKENSYDGMSPEREAYYRQKNKDDIRDGFLGLGEGLLAAPVGAAEAFVGLPGDLIGLAKGGKAAYNADEGQGWDAFEGGFNERTYLPTTQDIQDVTNKFLPSWMQEGMGSQGRIGGEFIAPGGYFKLAKKLGLNGNNIAGAGLLGGGVNIE